MKTTTTTTTQDSVQQDSETTQSTRHADISEFQVSPISMQEQIARLAYSDLGKAELRRRISRRGLETSRARTPSLCVNSGEMSGSTAALEHSKATPPRSG
jgi:hypothetical protein